MDDSTKILTGIAVKMLYQEQTLQTIKEAVSGGQQPTKGLARVLATIIRQAVAKAQEAGAQMSNKAVMQSIMALIAEVAEVLNLKGEKAKVLGKTLLGVTLQSLKQMTAVPQQQSPGQPQMPAGPQAMPGQTQPNAPQGLIQGAM